MDTPTGTLCKYLAKFTKVSKSTAKTYVKIDIIFSDYVYFMFWH